MEISSWSSPVPGFSGIVVALERRPSRNPSPSRQRESASSPAILRVAYLLGILWLLLVASLDFVVLLLHGEGAA